jgi:hypothetical protein
VAVLVQCESGDAVHVSGPVHDVLYRPDRLPGIVQPDLARSKTSKKSPLNVQAGSTSERSIVSVTSNWSV